VRRNILGALQALRCQFEDPGENERDGKPEYDQENDEPHSPVWNGENWKGLGRDLDDEPGDDRVGHRHSVNVAPLELGEEFYGIHHARGPVFRSP
jgi:hypothetical protein